MLLGAFLMVLAPLSAKSLSKIKSIKSVSEVYGDGAKVSYIVLEYSSTILAKSLSVSTYEVKDKTIHRVYANTQGERTDKGHDGKFVIIELTNTVSLASDRRATKQQDEDNKPQSGNSVAQKSGPAGGIVTGRRPDRKADPFPTSVTVRQLRPIKTRSGQRLFCQEAQTNNSSAVLLADDFKQLTFTDTLTGVTLRYNLYIPKGYDATQPMPMVLFMHDASGANQEDRYTLLQGNGATVWTSDEEQAKHPCFVVAPQYDEIVVDDSFKASASAEATIHLIEYLKNQYAIDGSRIYTTGQSMGCMLSYLLMSTHPDLFAAGYLVAGQWDARVIAPMATKPLWLVSCTGDEKSTAGAETALSIWRDAGAKTARALWPLIETDSAREQATAALRAQNATIRFTQLQGGFHNATWRVAYTFEGIRDWLFSQHQ